MSLYNVFVILCIVLVHAYLFHYDSKNKKRNVILLLVDLSFYAVLVISFTSQTTFTLSHFYVLGVLVFCSLVFRFRQIRNDGFQTKGIIELGAITILYFMIISQVVI